MTLPVVLLYHAIAPCPADADTEERGLFVDPTAFEHQMNDLVRRGYRSLTLDEYAAMVMGNRRASKSFLLTFDDAYAHVDSVVTPLLRRHGFTAVMFASWSHLGARNSWDQGHPNLPKLAIADRGQLVEMVSSGRWEVASHGFSHVDLCDVASGRRQAELKSAREHLSDLVQTNVKDLAYPFGRSDRSVREDARAAGYRMAFTMSQTRRIDPLCLPRRPIRGTDSLPVFRLKVSSWSIGLYRVGGFAPDWARSAARSMLGANAR